MNFFSEGEPSVVVGDSREEVVVSSEGEVKGEERSQCLGVRFGQMGNINRSSSAPSDWSSLGTSVSSRSKMCFAPSPSLVSSARESEGRWACARLAREVAEEERRVWSEGLIRRARRGCGEGEGERERKEEGGRGSLGRDWWRCSSRRGRVERKVASGEEGGGGVMNSDCDPVGEVGDVRAG
jgi:hypothetical protein